MFLSYGYILFEFVAIICLPIFAMFLSPAFLRTRHLFMIFSLLYIFFLTTKINFPTIISTLAFPSLKPLMFHCLIPSFIISLLIIIVHQYYPSLLVDSTKIINFFGLPKYAPLILYPLLSVPLQELIFRWFYVGRFQSSALPTLLIIVITAFVFGIVHLPFGNFALFIGTFVLGLWWNALYLSTGNLWYPILSHAITGNTLILLAIYPNFFPNLISRILAST
jgi:membrane protease YdiL (CAAX protease family)